MRMKLTLRDLKNYSIYMQENGKAKNSIESYGKLLMAFYDALPEGKELTKETIAGWIGEMQKNGYSSNTINTKISVLNGLLAYLGKKELSAELIGKSGKTEHAMLTRAEYIRLLRAAKEQEKERTYLLIKSICVLGIRIHEIADITVEGLEEGAIFVNSHGIDREIKIPEILKKELLQYAAHKNIRNGSVFVSVNGKPLNRINIFHDIKRVARDANVDEEKVNPKCLFYLYQSTQNEIMEKLTALAEYSYTNLLEQEETVIGWDT